VRVDFAQVPSLTDLGGPERLVQGLAQRRHQKMLLAQMKDEGMSSEQRDG
jgi:hypothetical protein